MKVKSNNLRKLEKNRYSILTHNLDTCYICKQPSTDIHEIYGGSNRQNSMKNGFCIPLCRRCHQILTNDPKMALNYKILCQDRFEKSYTRKEFIDIIGKNYL